MTTEVAVDLKKKSRAVTDGPDRAGARAMLRATGLDDADMDKPFVAIANLASDVTPCNVHLDRQAQKVKEGLRAADSVPFMFGTITISDGISMGTEGMKASLVSREVIADSIETVTFGESMDGLVVVAACDKNMPGAIMAIARCNVPSLFVYGGTIMPGNWRGEDINIQDMYEAIGAYSQGKITLDDLIGMERVACPGEGACAGMFTANTMSSAIEAMGMSIPGAASVPAIDPRNDRIAFDSGAVLRNLLEKEINPPRHNDPRGVRKRHPRRARHGRLDQRRPAHARHCPRVRRPPDHRRLRYSQPHHALHNRSQAGRPIRYVRHGRVRRRPGRDERAAKSRANT